MLQAKSIYLMKYSGPILNQGAIGACYPYATSAAMTLFMNAMNKPVGALSELGLYAHIRELQNTFSKDSGTYSWAGIKAIETYGISDQAMWSDDSNNLYNHPSAEADANAINFRAQHITDIGSFYTGWQVLEWTIKDQLSHGNPVLMGLTVHDWFRQEKGPLATQVNHYIPGVNSNVIIGGHEILIVGADDNLNGGSYIFQNSWGTDWGDNGFGTIRYDQFGLLNPSTNPNYEGPHDLLALSVIDQVVKDGTIYDNLWTPESLIVAELYNAVLNRAPEHRAFLAAGPWLAAGGRQAVVDFAEGLFASDEFKAAIPGDETNEQLVNYIYHTVLGREPDAGGLAWYLQCLNNGAHKGELVADMINEIMTGAKWGYYIWAGSTSADPDIKNESLRIFNRAEISQDYGITLQAGDEYGNLANHVLDNITYDPQSVQVALVGLSQLLGHVI